MTELLIKQKLFSWTDAYDVFDDKGQPKYYIKADFFSIGKTIHIYDKQTGEELARIQQNVIALLREYNIYISDELCGKIKRKLALLANSFDVSFKDWHIEGDFFAHHFKGIQNGNEIFTIQKEYLTWGDTYVLRIKEDADELSALIVTIAIDAACHDDQANAALY